MGIAGAEHAGWAQAGKIGFLNPSLQHPPMLSPAAARSPLHNRVITFRGYAREDGLWDLEGELHDTKHYSYESNSGLVAAGTPIHHLHIRVTVDDALCIQAIESSMDATPFGECGVAGGTLQRMVGQTMGAGWRQTIERAIGGVQGCCSTWPRPRSRPFRTRKKCAGARPGCRALKATSRRSTWAGA